MKEFRLQPKILFGEDSLDYLKTFEYKKVMIVTDEVMTQLKLTDFVTNSLSSTTEIAKYNDILAIFFKIEFIEPPRFNNF